jgi:anti-sigma regulatory factor (Ser/Thr protein kinase)
MPLALVTTSEITINNALEVEQVAKLLAELARTHGLPPGALSVPSPDVGKPIAERKIGGLGIHFLRTIMSEVTYSRAEGRNRLTLKRSLAQ